MCGQDFFVCCMLGEVRFGLWPEVPHWRANPISAKNPKVPSSTLVWQQNRRKSLITRLSISR